MSATNAAKRLLPIGSEQLLVRSRSGNAIVFAWPVSSSLGYDQLSIEALANEVFWVPSEACTRFRRKGDALWEMDTKKLPTPVVVFADRARSFTLITTVADASDFLFDNWSDNDSQQWTDALNQCAGADMGMTSVEDASVAFVLAVKTAGMRIDPTISLY